MARLSFAPPLALATLAGCSLAPAYQPPRIAAPAAYKEAAPPPPAGWAAARPQDTARGVWWRIFSDPVLDDLERRVERASPTLAAALARYDAARAQVRVAGADLSPQASIGASAERDHLSGRRPLAVGGAATYNEFTVGGSISYELDLWGRIRNEVAATGAEAQASAADLANVRLSLQAQVGDAYFRLRGFDAQRALLDRTVAAYARALDLTTTRHGGGVVSGLDVSRAQNILSDAKAQISDVRNARAATEHEIAALVGEPASSFSVAEANGLARPPIMPAELPSDLIQRRPDVAEAERRVFAANARIGVARAAFFPAVTLSALVGFQSSDIGNFIGAPNTFWAIGPSVLLSLFDGGRRRAEVDRTRAVLDESGARYRGTVLGAFQQVEDGLASARLLAQQSVDERAAAAAARRTEDLALVRYRDGASDYLEVVTAQTAALDAERTTIALETRRLQTAVALVRALGGGFDRAAIAANDPGAARP